MDSEEEEAPEEDEINHDNYKGIYVDEEPGQKFQDPETGAHFDYKEIYDRLIEVENEIGGSQERDERTVRKNQELLRIDEEGEEYMQNQLFKTEDNTLQKPREGKNDRKVNEVMSIGSDNTRKSYESKRIKSSLTNNKNILSFMQGTMFQKKSHDFGNLKYKSAK